MIFEHGFLQITLVKVMQRMMGLLKSKDVWILGKKEKVYQSSAACEIQAHCCITAVLVT